MIETKTTIGDTARSMLDGSLNYFQGAERLVNLREDAGIYENDPDFVVFISILHEVDYLRVDGFNFDWSLLNAPELEIKLSESLTWAKNISLANCASIAKRYAA